MFSRYAIYAVPDGIWGDAGASWLSWDGRTGRTVSTSTPDNLTRRPRKYGFHATIKAPFRLAVGAKETDLAAQIEILCAGHGPIPLRSLEIVQMGRFFALKAPAENDQIRALASDAVRVLDTFRAPLNDEEIARRRRARLSPRQDALLVQWGYPHVMDQFDFHLTLTGPTKDPDAARALLETHFETALTQSLILDSLSLMGEGSDGQFHQIERFALTGP